jgi:putrescine aminotransferase
MNAARDTAEAIRSETLGAYREHVNSGLAKLAALSGGNCELRSEGTRIYDESGNAYLDAGGYGVFLLGHRHPMVCEAVKAQIDRHPIATRALLSPDLAQAASALAAVAPPGLEYVQFTNSGAEAAELGLKLSRLAGRSRVISTLGGYHGKTLGALSVTGKDRYQRPFDPLLPGVEFIRYGDAEALAAVADGPPAALILEPVQGEGGAIVPADGYLREVERICREHEIFLIVDEIQTGMGRLGTWWGCQRENVTPDVMLVGKGLGGGVVPIGGVVATPEAFAPLNSEPLLHSSTFGGSPLAAAAARAAIQVTADDDLPGRAAWLGHVIRRELSNALAAECPRLVREVRGRGLLIGVEFAAAHLAADFYLEMLSRRVVICSSLNSDCVARLTPPAVLTEREVGYLIEATADSAAALGRRYRRRAEAKAA